MVNIKDIVPEKEEERIIVSAFVNKEDYESLIKLVKQKKLKNFSKLVDLWMRDILLKIKKDVKKDE